MGNQGGSNEGVNKVIEWVKSNKVGTISKVNVWTNRPVWPQGVNKKRMPLKDQKISHGTYGLVRLKAESTPLVYTPLTGEDFGNTEQELSEIWDVTYSTRPTKP